MNLRLFIGIMSLIFLSPFISGQTETYTIKKASFCTDKYDEFSPVYYKNGIVFCTNRNKNLFFNYASSQNKGHIKIYYIDTTGTEKMKSARLLSKNIRTKLNDGPVTFNSSRDTIYFSRNLITDGNIKAISGSKNKLGIFYSVFFGNKWSNTKDLRINNEWYNVTTPWLSPDGKRLYFASDKPGGLGGSDLYYCQWKNDHWDNPVNLGSVINTSGNEAYPFINAAGELFFSSDGHPGIGGKDIFFSRFADTVWLAPVLLDSPVNSKNDEFGIICDSMMNEGFFSSNREKTSDIYHFYANFHQAFFCDSQRINQYCFKFIDKETIKIDNNIFLYEWDFGDGMRKRGLDVEYCFQGTGKYKVKLNVIEKASGRVFFSKLAYDIELKDVEQPFINSVSTGIAGDTMKFDGLKSDLPSNKILEYTWDFGDGEKATNDIVNHIYKAKGEYEIKLALTLQNDSTRIIRQACVTKRIIVYDNSQTMSASLNQKKIQPIIPNILNYDHAVVKNIYSADQQLGQDAVFQLEILTSKTKLGAANPVFKNIPKKYSVKEVFLPKDSLYRYIAAEEMTLMATYPAYNELIASGFKNVVAKPFLLKDPAERELNILKKVYGLSADQFFGLTNTNISSNGFAMLDQIVSLMNKYPAIRLEIATHTDNSGLQNMNQELSQKRADIIVNYLAGKSISNKRLIAKGFGGTRPVASNSSEKDRILNRRVDFSIIRE
jgi:outer membrane protein OmpA-like peptidoglycan-associated protein